MTHTLPTSAHPLDSQGRGYRPSDDPDLRVAHCNGFERGFAAGLVSCAMVICALGGVVYFCAWLLTP